MRTLVACAAAGLLAGCGVVRTSDMPDDVPPPAEDGGGHMSHHDAATPRPDGGDDPIDGGAAPDASVPVTTSNAVDFDGDRFGDLFLYRPGRGAAWVARSSGDGSFTAP